MFADGRTTLNRVQLRRANVEPGVARLRLSHLLSTASLRPPALPPAAILVVRKMADPLPGEIAEEFVAGASATSEWEAAACAQLSVLYATAGRPIHGPAAVSAEAVVFADYAELLACLARDVSSGAAGAWWWSAVLGRFILRSPNAWFPFWLEQPRYIPAALEHLAERRQAIAVVGRLTPAQAWALLRALARAVEAMAIFNDRSSAQEVEEDPPAGSSIGEAGPTVARGGRVRPVPPWEPYVPAFLAPAEMETERRALLGFALLLRRAPQAGLLPEFAVRFQRWLRAEQRRVRRKEPRRNSERPGDPSSLAGYSPREGEPRLKAGGELRGRRGGVAEDLRPAPTLRQAEPALDVRAAGLERAIPTRPAAWLLPALAETSHSFEDGVDTRVGGILYLIHLLRDAELLRHFDVGLSAWCLLELVARCLLAKRWEGVADDPVWTALAELDGRDARVAPGVVFTPQRTYAAPQAWLKNLPERPGMVRFRSRGMEVWRPEGFLVLDRDELATPTAVTRAPRRLRQLADTRCAGLRPPPPLRRFLHFLMPYAHWRLRSALGGLRIEAVLIRTGKLSITRTHVDLVMRMHEISVPLRMAGLDANPGWVPELGRVVTFHFL
jgi:hypothetical protein